MKCVILQPSYIPWRGYFHQMHEADLFVFLDDVQYDARGWRNRNRIKTPDGARWITVPVFAKGAQTRGTPIHRIEISWESEWNRKHWASLVHAYGNAPFFDTYSPMLESVYSKRPRFLADFTIELNMALADILGIGSTRFMRSSQLKLGDQRKSERLLAILTQVGATRYLTGPTATDYLEEERFEAQGVGVEYMSYDYPEYPQLYPPFDPRVSILDLLFMVGSEAPRYIWDVKRDPSRDVT